MTKAQEMKIKTIENIMINLVGHPETKEIKTEDVTELDSGDISMAIEVGRIGDEGTAAQIYCRHYAHIFIGPRGGCWTYAKSRRDGKTIRYDDSVRGVCWRSVEEHTI